MTDLFAQNRIAWASRRGMLELDLVLGPFVEFEYAGLDQTDKERYVSLLEEQDQDLFRWFLKADLPEDPEHAAMVKLILERHAARG